ncbi:helix-turn-helix transcriptional regulator [bacterium]|nr:helix-turn-helix transcriptional regulator [bacterium]
MNYQELLCNNIRALRISNNMTQAKFAEKIGLSVEAIRNIEHQKYTPSATTIDAICNNFNLSPVDLLVPTISDDKNSIIKAINEKLKGCELVELNSINTIIDVIHKTYNRRN